MFVLRQVFKSLKRYSGLLARPAVAAAVQKELQALVLQIDQYLDNIQSDFEHRAQVCTAVCYAQSACLPASLWSLARLLLTIAVCMTAIRQLLRLPAGLSACSPANLVVCLSACLPASPFVCLPACQPVSASLSL